MEVAERRASTVIFTTAFCLAIIATTDAQKLLGHREQSPPSHHRAGYLIEQLKASQGTDPEASIHERRQAEAASQERRQGFREAELEGYNKLIQKEPVAGDGPQYEVVISRWNEAMDWIAQIPLLWDITIYNKGAEQPDYHTIYQQPNTSMSVMQDHNS